MKITILDDEPKATEMLAMEIKVAYPSAEIVGIYNKPEEALKYIPGLKPDLLFLDVDMPKYNGFEFLEALPVMDIQVIFTTAYSEYALSAIKANALDYLLKPLDSNEVKSALLKAKEKIKNNSPSLLNELFIKINSGKNNRLKLPTSTGIVFIKYEDIIYCKSESNYVHVVTSKKNYFIAKTLKFIEEQLPKEEFSRVHNSYLVNLVHISEYIKADGGYLIMSNDDQVAVSNSRKTTFLS